MRNQKMIHVKRTSDHTLPIPMQQSRGDAGYDLTTKDSHTLLPNSQILVDTGFAWAIPYGMVGLIKPRSGLAVKAMIDTKAGVIDSNYRGTVHALLRNDSNSSYHIEAGMRIAQMVIIPVATVETVEVLELEDTSRGINGFGSSGD